MTPTIIIKAEPGAAYQCAPSTIHAGTVLWAFEQGPLCPICNRSAA